MNRVDMEKPKVISFQELMNDDNVKQHRKRMRKARREYKRKAAKSRESAKKLFFTA